MRRGGGELVVAEAEAEAEGVGWDGDRLSGQYKRILLY